MGAGGTSLYNALKSLKSNKAVGLDKLSVRLLKDASDVIAPILTGLINKSFTDGVFPGVWKCAKVTALFKDGDKSLRADVSKYQRYYQYCQRCVKELR